jgi:hypothetical protein
MRKWDDIVASDAHRSLSWDDRGRQYDLYKTQLGSGGTANDKRTSKLFSQAYKRPQAPGQTYPQGEAAYAQEGVRMRAEEIREESGQPGPNESLGGYWAGMGSEFTNIMNSAKQVRDVYLHSRGKISTQEMADREDKYKEDLSMGTTLRDSAGWSPSIGAASADAIALAPAAELQMAAKVHKLKAASGVGALSAGTHPVDTEGGKRSYLLEKAKQTAPGAILAPGMNKATEIISRKFRGTPPTMEAAEEIFKTKILKGKTKSSEDAGQSAKDYVDYWEYVKKEGVDSVYADIKKAHQNVSIPITTFFHRVEQMNKDWQTSSSVTSKMYRQFKTQIKEKMGKDGKLLTEKQFRELDDVELNVNIEQLDQLEKNINEAITDAKGPALKALKQMKEDLKKSLIKDWGSDILEPARYTHTLRKEQGSLIIHRAGSKPKEVPLSEYINSVADEDVVRRVFVGGKIQMVRDAKEIFLRGKTAKSRTKEGDPLPEDMGQEGLDAWNNIRSELFAQGMKKSVKRGSHGQQEFDPDTFYDFLHETIGEEKLKIIFDEKEIALMGNLAQLDNRGLMEAFKATVSGPRLEYKDKMIREGLKKLLSVLYKGKETNQFADAIAQEVMGTGSKAYKNFRRGLGATLNPSVTAGGLARNDADHNMTLIKSMQRAGAK